MSIPAAHHRPYSIEDNVPFDPQKLLAMTPVIPVSYPSLVSLTEKGAMENTSQQRLSETNKWVISVNEASTSKLKESSSLMAQQANQEPEFSLRGRKLEIFQSSSNPHQTYFFLHNFDHFAQHIFLCNLLMHTLPTIFHNGFKDLWREIPPPPNLTAY